MSDWRNWIPVSPDWQTDAGTFGTLEGRWVGQAWYESAIAAVLASFFIVAIGWMLARGFNHAGLKRWVRSEMYQVLANAFLVVGLIAIVGIVLNAVSLVTADIATAMGGLEYSDVDTGLPTGVAVDNPFILAQLFLDENIHCLRIAYLDAYIADSWIEPVSQFSIGIAGMDAVSASTPLSIIVSALYFMAHNTAFLLLANYFQRHLLIFIYQTMFTLFLPIGIVLRTLPVTRGAGGFFIALAIGLYIVYPVSLSAMMLTARDPTSALGTAGCSLTLNAEELRGIHISDQASFQYHVGRATRLFPAIDERINLYSNAFPFFLIRSFLLPLIALTLVFTFVRTTAVFFGADIAEVSRGLVKLI
ncbi:hypothetical protein DRN67_00980 [Candidatus Micrarchaeota archaeon]|nr:MAG: hypothetical protein DRN67_00980 [Candidatus Micrarchaeota archaeon]